MKISAQVVLGLSLPLLFLSNVFSCSRSSNPVQNPVVSSPKRSDLQDKKLIDEWCDSIEKAHKKLGWEVFPCPKAQMQIFGLSVEGRPLVYWEYGNPASKNTTLIFSMVHGDEVTPLYLSSKLHSWLLLHEAELFSQSHVIVAPLVNPDSFFKNPRTRVNARGIDLNRNFATLDWQEKAHPRWKKYGSPPRRFPGKEPNSEPETLLQIALIEKYKPQKILSIHAPLNNLDYDGPNTLTLSQFPKDYVEGCLKLRNTLKARSTGYYAGSLGNYAGVERGIPTLTLELPTANPAFAKKYWTMFESGVRKVILFNENLAVSKNFKRYL